MIRCPCHEGYFDLDTGRQIAGPPRRPLPRIMLEVRGRRYLRDRRRMEDDMSVNRPFTREQRTTIVYGILASC